MIVKDTTRSKIMGNSGQLLATTGRIEFEEVCGICDKEIPNRQPCLRHLKSQNIICLECLKSIADLR
jgi:hypothetical protein